MRKARSLPASVKPSMPTSATLPAVACRLVQLRAGVALLLCRASANSRLVSCRPVPPDAPAKPLMPAPPTVIRRVCTVEPSASTTDESLLSMAKPPLACTKPKASSVRLPLALRILPSLPAMVSVSVSPGPVATVRFCAA